jgi:molecular chaperone GrpE
MTQRPATDPATHPVTDAAKASPNDEKLANGGMAEATPEVAAMPDPVQALASERDELKDRLLRTLAEMENLRRRSEKEMADTRAYAMTAFARDMLGVADNLRRALDNLPPETIATADTGLKAMLDGVDLTERDLVKTFERHGVRQIDPKGEKFDPNRHQAMFEAPNPGAPKGYVTEVVQIGYSIGERVLRPALVGVSAGVPKSVAPEAGASGSASAQAPEPPRS